MGKMSQDPDDLLRYLLELPEVEIYWPTPEDPVFRYSGPATLVIRKPRVSGVLHGIESGKF